MQHLKKYYFSTEGETEELYLKHLEKLINADKKRVAFVVKASRPMSFIKQITFLNRITVYHLFDVESNETEYVSRFKTTLDEMKGAERLGKTVIYKTCYSNFTFELWMILHKMEQNGAVAGRKNYLVGINKAFNKKFQSLNEFK